MAIEIVDLPIKNCKNCDFPVFGQRLPDRVTAHIENSSKNGKIVGQITGQQRIGFSVKVPWCDHGAFRSKCFRSWLVYNSNHDRHGYLWYFSTNPY